MATLIKRYGHVHYNGNKMVGRIVEAGKKLAAEDGDELVAWAVCIQDLQKLSYAKALKSVLTLMCASRSTVTRLVN